MTSPAKRPPLFKAQHLLAITDLSHLDITRFWTWRRLTPRAAARTPAMKQILAGAHAGEPVLRKLDTHAVSFEIAGKRLGADVMNMAIATSSVAKAKR